MRHWLVVIGEARAIPWIVEYQRMAFRARPNFPVIASGDRFIMYASRGAWHNPTRDEARIFAYGAFASRLREQPIQLPTGKYDKFVDLRFERLIEPRTGPPFRPLVADMSFVKKKTAWAAYLRKSPVPIEKPDYERLASVLDDVV